MELFEANLVSRTAPGVREVLNESGSMAGYKIDKAEWADFFSSLCRCVNGMLVGVETHSVGSRGGVRSEWLPLVGISYNPEDNILEITLQGLHHTIENLREVWVDAEAGEFLGFEVISSEGGRQMVHLRPSLTQSRERTTVL